MLQHQPTGRRFLGLVLALCAVRHLRVRPKDLKSHRIDGKGHMRP